MSTDSSAEQVLTYFPGLSDKQQRQLAQLLPLYNHWNSQINVISRKDLDQLYVRHVLHSLAIHKFLQCTPGSRVLDIGTGGGFPGIPLAILNPEVEFVLADSIGKKILVVKEICEAIGLTNVTAIHERAEKIKGPFDFVVSRAVAEMKLILQWSRGKIAHKQINALPNGIICLKGGDLTEELKGLGKDIETYQLQSWFSDPFFETKKLVYLPLV
ncbi:MAG: 16S rRNA (guanine(527)-N(7))-methyltransferase RsmG [Flavobacteriales bacterium]